jgi:hypothetical protein
MVEVPVGREDRLHLQPAAIEHLEQRFERRAAVDGDGSPPLAIGDEIGVREPLGIHGALDDHADLPIDRERTSPRARPVGRHCTPWRESF